MIIITTILAVCAVLVAPVVGVGATNTNINPVSGNTTTVTETTRRPLRGSLEGAEWRMVSKKLNFYETTPEFIRAALRAGFEEFDVLADPPVYPRGASAADYPAVNDLEDDRFDLS